MSFTGRRWFPRRRPHEADLNNAGVPIVPAPRPDQQLTSPPVARERQPLGGDDQHPSPHLQHIPTLLQLGFSVQEISALSGVPHALVELIAQQHPGRLPHIRTCRRTGPEHDPHTPHGFGASPTWSSSCPQ